MRLRICTVATLFALAAASLLARSVLTRASTDPLRLLSGARKLVVVTTPGWDAVSGTLRRYERQRDRWAQQGEPTAVVVGKSGMGWDRRISTGHEQEFQGPIKREGDGRSPAGVFALGQFFGYASSLPGSIRYLPLSAQTECVDDPASKHYGQVLERNSVATVDWHSSEQMRRNDELYRWGVIVDYDVSSVIPGAGSCIFLHIWRGSDQGTAGCTAMAPDRIVTLIRWLDDGQPSALVQLPQAEYDRLRGRWKLP
jgi:zinc D-Ala-D-Ala dipeptidase